jgi:hypothetical protein
VSNPPGQSTIAYRADDFGGFRHALLQPLADEAALLGWHPAPGDLALQLLEWWAYVAHVLTFYNERIANESYLRTAELQGNVRALVALTGYQPRPAIAAVGRVAALRTADQPGEPLVIPAGMQLASTATAGVPVQTFETSAATFPGPSDLPIELAPSPALVGPSGDSVLLSGTITGLLAGDQLLLVSAASSPDESVPSWTLVTVVSTTLEPAPGGGQNTRVALSGLQGLAGAGVADFRLLRSAQTAALWTQSAETAIGATSLAGVELHLSAVVPGIGPGDLVFVDGGGLASTVGRVTDVREQFRAIPYPDVGGPPPSPPDIPIDHTVVSLATADAAKFPPPPTGLRASAIQGAAAFESGSAFWVLTALHGEFESVGSAEASATLVGGPATLTWEAAEGATGYNLYRSAMSGGQRLSPALIATLPAGATAYTDTGTAPTSGAVPNPGGAVVAFGLQDVGSLIATPTSGLTSLPATVMPAYGEYLSPPSGLQVQATPADSGLVGSAYWRVTGLSPLGETVGCDEATAHLIVFRFLRRLQPYTAQLSWDPVDGAVGYRVYRATAPGGESTGPALVTTIPSGATTTFLDTGQPATSGAVPAVNTAVSGPLAKLLAEGDLSAFVQDAGGVAIPVLAGASDGVGVQLTATDATPASFSLAAPLQLLVDVVEVSRGATVRGEALGTGDGNVSGQTFALAQAPLTYVAAGAGYASTLQVAVDGILWTEVGSFYGESPDARVFLVVRSDDGTAQVRFGDGVNGSRLPTGAAVVASYRYGAGAASPPSGRLTTILSPQPNLASVQNPIAVSGGADAEQPDSIRQSGPASVLTFGRAISADDYETVAALAPGVARARAYSTWDAAQQRMLVKIYVGDDAGAKAAATAALAGAEDPNRRVAVVLATPTPLTVSGTLLIAADRIPSDVLAAASAALADSAAGLFSAPRMGIGQSLYSSQVEAALLVDGAVAVRSLTVTAGSADVFASATEPVASADPGQGSFYTLAGAPQLAFQVANG